MIADLSDKTKDIGFMNHPNRWIAFGGQICPLGPATKLESAFPSIPRLAFLVAGHGFKVHIGLMYEIGHLKTLRPRARDYCPRRQD